jgi:hydrogenase expression/formation protein HypE
MKEKILLSYGSGGKHTFEFINNFVLKYFSNDILNQLLDSAVIKISDNTKLAFSIDSYTVTPNFFPGGDIGKLSICGTVNDLLCVGAKPLFISLSLIIEEGLETEVIEKIFSSIKEVSEKENVKIVTGDTKVVQKGMCDKIFITTAGIGVIENNIDLNYNRIEPGDVVIITGSIAEHGCAVLLSRGAYGFKSDIQSDCASLKELVEKVLASNYAQYIKFMRDPTRGGVAAALNEIVNKTKGLSIEIEEEKIPIKNNVKYFCDLLGFDPLNIANEGKMLVIVSETVAEEVVKILKQHPLGKDADIIGKVVSDEKPKVVLKTLYGAKRIVELPIAEELPRIC